LTDARNSNNSFAKRLDRDARKARVTRALDIELSDTNFAYQQPMKTAHQQLT